MPLGTAQRDRIDFTYSEAHHSIPKRAFIRTVEMLGGQPKLKKLYDHYVDEGRQSGDFFESAIDLMQVNVNYDASALFGVPREGPVIFLANHPYGVLDGIVLTWLARKARPDVKVMANHVLCQAPDAGGSLLPVDFSQTKEAMRTNLNSRQDALAHLRDGGAIGLFPAGGVGASEKPLIGPAVDTPWHPFSAKLIKSSKATIVPIYFAGQNSRMFQIASHVSYTLRLSLFFFETARRIGTDLDVVIGSPIEFDEISHFENRLDMMMALRKRLFGLAQRLQKRPRKTPHYDRVFNFPKHIRFN